MDYSEAKHLDKYHLEYCITFTSASLPGLNAVYVEHIFVPHLIWWADQPGDNSNYARTGTREFAGYYKNAGCVLPEHAPRDLRADVSLRVSTVDGDPVCELPWFSAGTLQQKSPLHLKAGGRNNAVPFTHARIWFNNRRMSKIEVAAAPVNTPTIWGLMSPLTRAAARKRKRDDAVEELTNLPAKRRRIEEEHAARLAALTADEAALRKCIADSADLDSV